MRVLWISNIIFPEASREIGLEPTVFEGWLASSAVALQAQDPSLAIGVASLYSGSRIKIIDNYKIKYYLIPQGLDDAFFDQNKVVFYRKVISDFKPDLVHIHGTEYPHSLAAAIACDSTPFVVSIQGIVSECSKYYYAGLLEKDIIEPLSIKERVKNIGRHILGRSNPPCAQRYMEICGEYEKQLLCLSKHVIGRTTWDRAHCWAINPVIDYHFCNETLRPTFYSNKWNFESCEKYSIFISQGSYPLKGLHQLLKALPHVIKQYPDTRVYVAGKDILHDPYFLHSGYSKYIQKLIKANSLNNIYFIGQQNEREMAERLVRSHIFISLSSIENSPNSVGEAQLIGTPCIGSYVGGTMDMIKHGETGFLYRFEDTEILAFLVCYLFASRELCENLSNNERTVARIRHNRQTNAIMTLDSYKTIIRKNYE